jgi:hypothetical protein
MAWACRASSTTVSMFWSEQDRMVPLRWPSAAVSSTAISKLRLRSATDIEKNSPCLPEMNRPPMPRSPIQWRRLRRRPASSSARSSGRNGVGAAAQTPRRCSRA